jgi:DNA-binding NarL/FixJ family response regulator
MRKQAAYAEGKTACVDGKRRGNNPYSWQTRSFGNVSSLPQLAEIESPRTPDAPRKILLYDEGMTRVYIADALAEERTALRLMTIDLNMEVVGEAADWTTAVAQAPSSRTEMLLVDWNLLPKAPASALEELRGTCSSALVIVLISHLDARQQAAVSSGADAFISKGETPERVAERLQSVAGSIRR